MGRKASDPNATPKPADNTPVISMDKVKSSRQSAVKIKVPLSTLKNAMAFLKEAFEAAESDKFGGKAVRGTLVVYK